MKVKCGNCRTIFEYEENKKVCPNCKKFCALPEDKKTKETPNKENKPKIKVEEQKKVEPKIEEPESTIDLSEVVEKRKSKKMFYLLLTLFLAVVILPISMTIFSDPSEKVDGPDGVIISTTVTKLQLSEAFNDLFYVEKVGYTNSGNLYVVYESNLYGFANAGYEIKFNVIDVEGNNTLLGCIGSDFAVLKGAEADSYITKAIFNYTNENPRLKKLIVTINDVQSHTINL